MNQLLNPNLARNAKSRHPLLTHLHRKLFATSPNVEEQPLSSQSFRIKSMNLKDKIKPIRKIESFVKRSFFGELDKDYLIFPDLLHSRQERTFMCSQYEFVRRNFTRLCSTQNDLENCGLYDMSSMTLFEISHLFEAIGASLNYRSSFTDTSQCSTLVPIGEKLMVTDTFMTNYQETKTFVQTIIPLLVHNLLVMGTIEGSSNLTLKYLLDGKPTRPNIAFAFCELNEKFSTLPYPFWDSLAVHNKETDNWILNGSKSRIIKSNYDYYIIFCKTLKSNQNSNPKDNFDIVAFLVDKNSLSIENDGTDNYGNQYLRISFKDLILSREKSELFPSHLETSLSEPLFSLNIKAKGQVASSAIVLGLMKETMENIHKSLKVSSSEQRNRSLIETQLCQITEIIYSLESMIYLTASHFDSFHEKQIDLFLQALVVKVLATELSTEMLKIVRFLFDAHQLSSILSSQVGNVINVLDSFLESTNANRMLLATYGLRYIGSWKFDYIAKMRLGTFYLSHFLKYTAFANFNKQSFQRYSGSMDDIESLKNLHPSLKESANLLKKVLQYEKDMGVHILRTYGKDCVRYQIDMNRFASIAMSAFQMVSVISRCNQSLTDATPQSQQELLLCGRICLQESKKAYFNTRLIEGVEEISEEKRSQTIHNANIQFDGYFAKPTFDRVI